MQEKEQLSVRLPQELVRSFRGRCSSSGRKYQHVIEQLIREWMAGDRKTRSVTTHPASAEPLRYRPENLEWHDRLEMTLNDPDEKLGIQKNLEWAERTVTFKLNQLRPAGKRASGE